MLSVSFGVALLARRSHRSVSLVDVSVKLKLIFLRVGEPEADPAESSENRINYRILQRLSLSPFEYAFG